MLAPGGVLSALPDAASWIDMTSASPVIGRELASAARDQGVGMLEAPVGGGVRAAVAGTLHLFVGGDARLLERHRTLLEAFADPDRIIRMGGSAASSSFIRHDLDALFDGDYLTSFGLDRCCEELSAITALARQDGVPFELSEHVEQIYQRALARYGPADGELLPVAMLEASRSPAAPSALGMAGGGGGSGDMRDLGVGRKL